MKGNGFYSYGCTDHGFGRLYKVTSLTHWHVNCGEPGCKEAFSSVLKDATDFQVEMFFKEYGWGFNNSLWACPKHKLNRRLTHTNLPN